MSEITNTATIRVVADASGVEAGLRPAEQAVERTGRAISQVSSGATSSGRSVEAAQRNIVAAIQRTTIAMESGGRQTAAYYEALARQRGVDPNVLTPYLNQLRLLEQAQNKAGVSAEQTTAAMRQLPAQVSDVFSSLAGGQSPFMVLIQQGGQIKDSFGGVRNAIQAIGGEVKSFFGITSSGAESLSSVNDVLSTIVGTQDSAAQSGENLAEGLGGAADSANSLAEAGTNAQTALAGVTRTTGILIAGAAAVAAVVAALAYAYKEGAKEADGYKRAIIESANAAGVSTSQLSNYAAAISKTVGTQAQAAQALAALTTTGQVGTENLKQFGEVAIQVQKYIGRSVEDTVKDFEELGKSPVESILKLDDSYHFLTASVYEQIKALQEQGKSDDAAELAQKTYAAAFADRAAKMKDNLGLIERAWMGAKDSASSAWDVFLGVGRKKTPAQELAEVQAQIALARQPAGTRGGDSGDAAEMRRAAAASKLTELLKREGDLQKQIDKEALDAQAAAAKEKLRQAKLSWSQIMDTTVSQTQKMRDEVAEVTQKGIDAGASPEDIKKAVDKVKQKYFDLNNVTLTQLENRRALEKEKMAGELADLESQQKLQLISQETFLAKKRDMQVREIDLEIPIIKKQAEIASGKEDKAAREKANGELQVLLERRKNIIKGAANAIDVSNFDRKKTLDSVVAGWNRAIAVEQDAVNQEVLLFGKSDQARTVILAQMKVEANARDELAKLTEKGIILSKQERAEFDEQTDAAKQKAGQLASQKLALAAANQLLRDNLRFSAEYIADADLRARRLMEIDAEQWQYLINNTAEGSEARKKILEQFDVWMANRQMQPVLDRWKGVIDSLDNNFQEGFRDMLTSGQGAFSSFAKSIGNTLKTALADALYQTFIKKYVVQIVTSLAGAISGPAVAATLTGGAAGSAGGSALGSAGGSMLGAATGSLFGAGGVGGSLLAGAGWLTGSTTLAGSLGAAGSLIGTGTAGGIMSGLGMVAGALGPIALGVAGIMGIVNKLDHSGTPHTGGAASASASGVQNINAGTLGLQRIDISDAAQQLTAQLASSVVAILDSTATTFGKTAGYTAATAFADDSSKDGAWGALIIKNMDGIVSQWGDANSRWAPSVFADGEAGQKQYLDSVSKSVRAALDKIGLPDWAKSMLDALGNAPALEDLAKVVDTINATEKALAVMGERLAGFASLSGSAVSTLISASGGIDALAASASAYYDAFYSESEKTGVLTQQVTEALKKVGLAMPATSEAYRAQVEAQLKLGDAGASAAAVLLSMAGAAGQVYAAGQNATNSMQAVADERAGLQDQLDQLTMTSTQLLKKQRDALNEANRPLFDMIQMAQKLADTSSGLATFRDSVKSLHDGLLTGSLSTLTPEQQYAELRSQYDKTKAAALAGDTKAQESYDDVLTAFLTASQKLNSGDSQYQADFAMAQQDSASIAAWATGQIDTAQQQLNAMNSQTVALISANTALDTANRILESISQNTAPVSNPAYVLNTSFSMLTTAIKSMRDSIKEELAGLRKDQDGQTGESIAANAEAQQSTAENIVAGFAQVAARLIPSNQKVVLE